MKFQHILVPIDFSKSSQIATDWVGEAAAESQAKVTLFHSVEPMFHGEISIAYLPADEDRLKASTQHLEQWSKAMNLPSHWERQTLLEIPWRGIVEYAKQHKVDLIVLPTHGRTGLKHLWIGSVAERVVQHAHCPVLVLRGTPQADEAA